MVISHIRGKILHVEGDHILVESLGGIGFEIKALCLPKETFYVGQWIACHVHTQISDYEWIYLGLSSMAQKQFFLALLKIKQVGPKTAISILQKIYATQPTETASFDDYRALLSLSFLSAIPGIGPKTAKLILDHFLKIHKETKKEDKKGSKKNPKVGTSTTSGPIAGPFDEAKLACLSLGMEEYHIDDYYRQLQSEGLVTDLTPTEELMKSILVLHAKQQERFL